MVVAIGIRRQADRAEDVVNLARLINDIARHPDALSRDWYRGKYPVEMRDMAATTFDEFAGADRSHVDRAIIRAHLATLRSIAKTVTVYVNTHVAHAAETQDIEIPPMTISSRGWKHSTHSSAATTSWSRDRDW